MATDLATPSNQLAKMRWKEPYVSEGLNKKLNGIIPSGVIRGGRLVASGVAMSVTIQDDPETGDSVYSFIDATGHQLTFRQQGDVTLDLTAVASTTVYIGLEITYVISAATVVKWRAFSLAEIQADPTLVVLGRVDVPASGLIPASDIYPEERRDAWTNTSHMMRGWKNVVKNGDFEMAELNTSFTAVGDQLPYFTTGSVGGIFDVQVVRTDPYEGLNHLQITGSGAGGFMALGSWGYAQVTPGRFIHAKFAIKGNLWGGVGAGGCQGLFLSFFDDVDGATIASQLITDNSLSGDFPWQEVEEVVEVPATARWMRWAIYVNDAGTSPTGSIYIDAVRVFVEQDELATDSNLGGEIRENTVVTNFLQIAPAVGSFANLQEYMEKTLRLRMDSFGTPYRYFMQHLLGDLSWDLELNGGGLRLDRGIKSIGSVFTGDADKDIQATERMVFPLMNSQLGANARWVLIWEGSGDDVGRGSIRVYASTDNYDGSGPGFNITCNARYDANNFEWVRDIAGNSGMYVFTHDRFYRFVKESGSVSPWGIGSWDHSLVNEYYSNTNDKFYRFLHDCYTQIINTATTQSNPPYGTSTAANATYAKNIVKAWGHALTDGAGGFTSREGFGADMSLSGVGRIAVTLKDAMDSGEYAVAGLIHPNVVPPHADWSYGLSFWNMAAGSFDLTPVDRPTGTWGNFDTGTWQVTFIVLGQQTT